MPDWHVFDSKTGNEQVAASEADEWAGEGCDVALGARFALSLGIVVGVLMLTYVTVPARVAGIKLAGSRRDKMGATVIGGTLGAIVCSPAYILGRLGILLLGSHVLFALGVILLVIGAILQAGATGAVKAIKMSAKLAAGNLRQQPTAA